MRKNRKSIAVVLISILLLQVFSGFGGTVLGAPAEKALIGQLGNDGSIYYKGISPVGEGEAVNVTGIGTTVSENASINEIAGLTLGQWRMYYSTNSTVVMEVKIAVETAGTYQIAMGNHFKMPAKASMQVNGGEKTTFDTDTQTADYKPRWDIAGTFDLTAGVNTLTITTPEGTGGNMRLDTIRITADHTPEVSPSIETTPSTQVSETPSASPAIGYLSGVAGNDGKLYYKGQGNVGPNEAIVYTEGEQAGTLVPSLNTSITQAGGLTFDEWRIYYLVSSNKYIDIKFNVETAGTYQIELGNKFKMPETVIAQINGGDKKTFQASQTKDYEERWDIAGIFELKQGVNVLRLSTSGVTGNMRFDTLRLGEAEAQTSPSADVSESPSASPAAGYLSGALGDDGNIYYKGQGELGGAVEASDGAIIAPNSSFAEIAGLTFSQWRLYMTGGSTSYIRVKIDVEEAGRYKLELGNYFNMPVSFYLNLNGTGQQLVSGTNQAGSYKDRWDLLGYYDLREGINTIELSPMVQGTLRFDTLRLGDPSDEPEPEDAYFFDDGDPDVFKLVGALNDGDQTGSTYSGTNYNTTSLWSYINDSYGQLELKDLPAGKYELYYHIPMIHANNTKEMYVEVSTKLGQTYETKLDLTAEGGHREGEWVKLGEELYTFDYLNTGYVRAGKTENGDKGCYRIDAVKAVRVEQIEMPPRVKNLTVEGTWRPGGTLTGKYEFIQDNFYDEKDSILKWYSSADSQSWTEIGTGKELILTENEIGKYIKFEVTPVCDTENQAIKTGEPVSVIADRKPEKDSAGKAYDLRVDGKLLAGQELTAWYSFEDSNLDPEGDSVYQWYRAGSANGAMTAIEGANGSCKAGDTIRYTLTQADIGAYIQLIVTAKSSNLTRDTKSDSMGPVVEIPADAPTAKWAAISGAATTDRPMTAFYAYNQKNGVPEGNSLIQWYISDSRDGEYTPIPNASGKSYQATAEQKYQYIKFSVTPVSETGWSGETVESEPKQIKWDLDWYDEFDYESADGGKAPFTDKWVAENSRQGHILSGRYHKNVEVSDGVLKLKQFHEDPPVNGQDWTAGSVHSNAKLGYGYYEARYKYAAAAGLNNSFWIYSQHAGGPGPHYEIDMNEGHYTRSINSNIQSSALGVKENINYRPDYVETMADDFHTFEMEWNENELLMYCDGKLYRRSENVFCDPVTNPAYVYFSVAVMAWAGAVNMDVDGSVMEVDYFRYYKCGDDSSSYVDTEGLCQTIDNAQKAVDSAVIGSKVGNYKQSSVDTLKQAIASAKAALGKSGLTQEEVRQAQSTLAAAMDTFYESMVSTGVLSADDNVITLPEVFTKDVVITALSNHFDAQLRVKKDAFLARNVTYRTKVQIGRKEYTAELLLNRNTTFEGDADADGYITLHLPRQGSGSFDVTVPGSVNGSLDMGITGTNSPVRLMIMDFGNVNDVSVGYIHPSYLSGSFVPLKTAESWVRNGVEDTDTLLKQYEMQQVTLGVDPAHYAIWTKGLSPVIFYKPTNTPDDPDESIIHNGGNPNPPYYPDEKPSPSPSEEPTVSPSTEPTNNPVDFKDIKDHWAEKEIVELAEKDIIKGVTEDEFMPDKSITRAEFTALIVRTLGLQLADYKNGFNDVKETDWFAQEIQTALENGIISKDEMFRPNDTMTREEMTKVMVEALKKATGEEDLEKADLGQFKDAEEISGWAKEYVAEALHTGLIKGISEEEFSPKTNATRAQGAVMIHRLLGMIAKG